MRRFPETGQKVNQFRQEGIPGYYLGWPHWCFLPPACFGIIVEDALGGAASEEDIALSMPVLATLATWRYTQGIYRLGPVFMAELTETPLIGAMPVERFHHLPQWCVYVETPGMAWFGEPVHGFWAHMAWNVETHAETLVILLDKGLELRMCLLDVGPWSIREGVQRGFGYTKQFSPQARAAEWVDSTDMGSIADALTPFVAIVLYLCSETPDIMHEHMPGLRPTNPQAKKTRHGLKLFPPAKPTVWRVGEKAGAVLR
jgi:hypothetical protein